MPPGHDDALPADHFVCKSATNNLFIFLRSFYQDENNLTPAVALMEKTKVYPLGAKANATPMQFPDASGAPVNMLPASDATAFDHLKQLVDSEGVDFANPDWRGMLASLGIVKGRSFRLDAGTRAILDLAARTAYKMSRVLGREETVGGVSYRIYRIAMDEPGYFLIWNDRATSIWPDRDRRWIPGTRLADQLLHQLLLISQAWCRYLAKVRTIWWRSPTPPVSRCRAGRAA